MTARNKKDREDIMTRGFKIRKRREDHKEKKQTINFDQAFRIYKKDCLKARTWYTDALKVFVQKQIPSMQVPLDQWTRVFRQY